MRTSDWVCGHFGDTNHPSFWRNEPKDHFGQNEPGGGLVFGSQKYEPLVVESGRRVSAHCFRIVIYNGWRNSNVSAVIREPKYSFVLGGASPTSSPVAIRCR